MPAASAVGSVFTHPCPTSRGRLPAAVGGREPRGKRLPSPKKGFSRDESLERVRAEPAVLPAGWWGMRRRGGREDGLLRARKGGKRGKNGLDRMPRPGYSPRKAKAMRCAPQLRFLARRESFLMGKTPPQKTLSREPAKIRRANSEALLPRRGKQRRIRTPAAPLAPTGQGSGRKDAPTSFSARNARL